MIFWLAADVQGWNKSEKKVKRLWKLKLGILDEDPEFDIFINRWGYYLLILHSKIVSSKFLIVFKWRLWRFKFCNFDLTKNCQSHINFTIDFVVDHKISACKKAYLYKKKKTRKLVEPMSEFIHGFDLEFYRIRFTEF